MANKKINTFCSRCIEDTNHHLLYLKKMVTTYDSNNKIEPPSKELSEYMVVQCKGCNDLSFLLRYHGDCYKNNSGDSEYIDYNYPEPILEGDYNVLSIEEKNSLPNVLSDLYNELDLAFQNDSNKLAGVGLRMLVEAICLEEKINGKNLKIRIEKLHERGLISKNEIPILDKLREMGNVSVHEIKSFPINKLKYALEIINHILKSIYILPGINKKLKL